MNRIKIFEKAPTDLFDKALNEIKEFDWSAWNKLMMELDIRARVSAFKTSTALHLRRHDAPSTALFYELCDTVKCIDTKQKLNFPSIMNLVNWIYDYVEGVEMGRIMITRLEGGGVIKPHIDPGKYFQSYYRFHIPLITNENVKFIFDEGEPIHMPVGVLSQLNNRINHGVENTSNDYRIHIIADIDSKNSKFKL